MSYDKNTIVVGNFNRAIDILRSLDIPYIITVLGKVKGLGRNDFRGCGTFVGEPKYYEIRKLEYNDYVILERMYRTTDCDSADYILTKIFHKDKVPKDWTLEITYDEEGKIVEDTE